jgi:pilus assembly protein TadC
MFYNKFLAEFGKAVVPKKVRPNLRNYVMRAGFIEVPYTLFGLMFYISLPLTYAIFATLTWDFIQKIAPNPAIVGIMSFFVWTFFQFIIVGLIVVGIYFYMDLRIFNRTQEMESLLADYLQLVSTNLRGGMSFEKSLWSAINPDFSVLANEVSLTSKKVLTGYDMDVALQEFADKYDSAILKRTISLIIGEIKSGGKIADLLDRIIEDLKETKELKQEMEASVVSYMIFIGVIVIVISPGLFALSYNLLSVITGFTSRLAEATSGGGAALPISFATGGVDQNSFRNFSYAAIALISFFSSMIVAILEKGTVKGGIKYLPVFVGVALVIYQVLMMVLNMVFGRMIL